MQTIAPATIQTHEGADEIKHRPQRAYDPAADIIRPRHLPEATGLSVTTVWRERRAGRFPAPIKLTDGGAVGWLRQDIERWRARRQQKSA